MLSLKIKDLKYRLYFSKIEKKKNLFRFFFINFLNKKKNKNWKKKKFIYLFFKFNYYSKLKYKTKTKIVRRCSITSRNRGNFRIFNISRFFLRSFMQFGILPGYKKAVW